MLTVALPETIELWVSIKFSGEWECKIYPSCTLLRNTGGNHHGFNASLSPSTHSSTGYSSIEARLLADLAKIRLLGGKSSAILKNSGGEGAAPASGGITTHVPKFQTLAQVKNDGASARVSTVTVAASVSAQVHNCAVFLP